VLSCIEKDKEGGVPADLVNAARHDFVGNSVKTVDPAGTATEFVYDARRMPVETTFTGAAGETGTDAYAYDCDGNRVFHSDPCGWCEAWAYDKAARPTHALARTGLVTQRTYGLGGMVWTETQYATRTIEPQTTGNNGNSTPAQDLDALKQNLAALAQKMANGSPGWTNVSPDRIYADAQYWRDEHGNVWKTSRLFESTLPDAVSPGAHRADFLTGWTPDGLDRCGATEKTRFCRGTRVDSRRARGYVSGNHVLPEPGLPSCRRCRYNPAARRPSTARSPG
jgi:YD repeat-containing protein